MHDDEFCNEGGESKVSGASARGGFIVRANTVLAVTMQDCTYTMHGLSISRIVLPHIES